MVVVADPPRQPGAQLGPGLERVQVDALILQAAPQPLDENVVHPASAAVHGDAHLSRPQHVGEVGRRELAALIGVEYLPKCQGCAIKAACTTGKERRVKRWEHENVLDAMQKRLDQVPQAMALRRRLLLGSGVVVGSSHNQAGDQGAEQGFAASACIVHELEEAEIKR